MKGLRTHQSLAACSDLTAEEALAKLSSEKPLESAHISVSTHPPISSSVSIGTTISPSNIYYFLLRQFQGMETLSEPNESFGLQKFTPGNTSLQSFYFTAQAVAAVSFCLI